MTSRSSFWKLSLFNIKKRIWTYALAIGILFCAMPFASFMNISISLHQNGEVLMGTSRQWYIDNFIGLHIVGVSFYGFLAGVIATIFALQGFSYLQSQKKIDMYKSVPVKENVRFAYITINSIAGYMVIFIVNILLVDLCFALNGIMCVAVWKATVFSIIYNFVVFSAVYFLTSIAQIICGSTILAFFGSLVLLTVEPIISGLIEGSKSTFFTTYYTLFSDNDWMCDGVLTPLEPTIAMVTKVFDQPGYFYYDANQYGILTKYLVVLFIQSIVFGTCAFVAYKKRPAQIGGKSIVFKPLKWIIKIVILFVGIFFSALALASIAGISDQMCIVYGFLGIALSFVILHCVLQTILEKDFRECLKGFGTSVIALAIAVAVYCIFAFDLVGFDSYIPSADKIANYVMIRDVEYLHDYYDDDFSYCNNEQYLLQNAMISDSAIIAESVDTIQSAILDKKYRYTDYDDSVNEGQEYVVVCYELTNGKKVYRNYTFKPDTVRTLFVSAYSDDDYRTSLEEINCKQLSDNISNKDCTASIGYNGFMSPYSDTRVTDSEKVQEIYEALCLDVNERSADVILDEPTIGEVGIEISQKPKNEDMYYNDNSMYFYIKIYDCDERTIALLKEYELFFDDSISPEDVDYIECENYDDELGYYNTELIYPGDEGFEDIFNRFVIESSMNRMLGHNLYVDTTRYVYVYDLEGNNYAGYLKFGELAE